MTKNQYEIMKRGVYGHQYEPEKCWEVLIGKREYIADLERIPLFFKIIENISLSFFLSNVPADIIRELTNKAEFQERYEHEPFIYLKKILEVEPGINLNEFFFKYYRMLIQKYKYIELLNHICYSSFKDYLDSEDFEWLDDFELRIFYEELQLKIKDNPDYQLLNYSGEYTDNMDEAMDAMTAENSGNINTLISLYQDSSILVKKHILKNADCPDELVEKMIEDNEPEILTQIARMKFRNSDIYKKIIDNADIKILIILAHNQHLSASSQSALYRLGLKNIHLALCRNRRLKGYIRTLLSQHYDVDIRREFAKFGIPNSNQLIKLSYDFDKEVRNNLLKNTNLIRHFIHKHSNRTNCRNLDIIYAIDTNTPLETLAKLSLSFNSDILRLLNGNTTYLKHFS